MDRNSGTRDQSNDPPSSTYYAPSPSQFTQSQYPVPTDSELNMSSSYSMPASYAQQLQDATSSKPSTSPTQPEYAALPTNGANHAIPTDPAMAPPPQTPNSQSFSAPAPHPGLDDPMDITQTPQTGDKRKRSKVSRACDECRRKKIRCDAPTDSDGTPRTCANCEKAGLLCGFERKPMKRGPSKGYIKDLADRVQSVEQIQAAALRQSYDLGSGPQSFDQLAFSPNESSNTRPRYSFTSAQGPFAQAEFQRDRIPSTGAWGSNQPDLPDLRSRDNGSLALAPDQTLPTTSLPDPESTKIAQLFASELDRSRPAKRQKVDQSYEHLQPFELDQGLLTKYYDQYHPLVGLLPDSATVLRVVADVSHPVTSHAFGVVLQLLRDVRSISTTNGVHDPEADSKIDPAVTKTKGVIKSTAFRNVRELSEFLQERSIQPACLRSTKDNLVILWTLLLLVLLLDDDLSPHSPLLPRSQLIATSWQIIQHLETAISQSSSSADDDTQLSEVLQGSQNFTILSSKLDTLSHGTSNFTQASYALVEQPRTRLASEEASYLFNTANVLQNILALQEFPLASQQSLNARNVSIFAFLPLTRAPFPTLSRETPIVRHFESFVHLVLARDFTGLLPSGILSAATTLADHLIKEANLATDSVVYNPLDIHTYPLVTTVLLEFTRNSSNVGFRESASSMIDSIKSVLEKKSANFHKGNGFEWFFANSDSDVIADGYRMTHWSDQLLAMISWVKQRGVSDAVKNSSDHLVPDFAGLYRKGALTVVEEFGWHLLAQQEVSS